MAEPWPTPFGCSSHEGVRETWVTRVWTTPVIDTANYGDPVGKRQAGQHFVEGHQASLGHVESGGQGAVDGDVDYPHLS